MNHSPHSSIAISLCANSSRLVPLLAHQCTIFEPRLFSSAPAFAPHIPNVNTRPVAHAQWIQSSNPLESPSLVDCLFLAVKSCQPNAVYIVCPSIPIHNLDPEHIRYVLDVTSALQQLLPPIQDSNSAHLSTQSTGIECRITLLFERRIPLPDMEKYHALFSSHQEFCGPSATAVLSIHMHNPITPPDVRWSGAIHIPDRTDSFESTTILPGFQMISTDPSFPRISSLKSTHARILSISPRMPTHAALLCSRSGLQLRLSESCPSLTASFYNALALSNESMLVAIGDVQFWCCWDAKSCMRGAPVCHTFYIEPLSTFSVEALDISAWRTHEQFTDPFHVRDLPSPMVDLSVYPLFDDIDDEEMWTDFRIGQIDAGAEINDALIQLGKWDPHAISPSRKVVSKRTRPVPSSSFGEGGAWEEDICGAELRSLPVQLKGKTPQGDGSLIQGKRTNSMSKSESCSLLETKSLSGKKGTGRMAQLTMRQQRFQRLMQTQRDKQTVENATTISSLGQRGKRVRSISDKDMGRRRMKKVPRQSSDADNDYLIHDALRKFKDEKPFFPLDERQYNRSNAIRTISDSVHSLGNQLGDWGNDHADSLNPKLYESHGKHGVEFVLENDERDVHIVAYETAVAKTSHEFSGLKPPLPQQQSKLMRGLRQLQNLAKTTHPQPQRPRPIKLERVKVATEDNCRTFDDGVVDKTCSESGMDLLRCVIEGMEKGTVVVTDPSLRLRLHNATVISSL